MRDTGNNAPNIDTRTAVEIIEEVELLLEEKRKQHEALLEQNRIKYQEIEDEYRKKILELRKEFETMENPLLIEISQLERIIPPLKGFERNICSLINAVRDHDILDLDTEIVLALFDDTKSFVLPDGQDFSLDEKKKREIITYVLA